MKPGPITVTVERESGGGGRVFCNVTQDGRQLAHLKAGQSWTGDPAVRNEAKCHYCDNPATKFVIWLKDKHGQPARTKMRISWCGCDLTEAMKRFWPNPYTVRLGVDYEVDPPEEQTFLEAVHEQILEEIRLHDLSSGETRKRHISAWVDGMTHYELLGFLDRVLRTKKAKRAE